MTFEGWPQHIYTQEQTPATNGTESHDGFWIHKFLIPKYIWKHGSIYGDTSVSDMVEGLAACRLCQMSDVIGGFRNKNRKSGQGTTASID